MFHPYYEKAVSFASDAELRNELTAAREEYVTRTGDLFESDGSYERRIASFLEWYVLDRTLPESGRRPIELFAEKHQGGEEFDREGLIELQNTQLSLFEFRRAKNDGMKVTNLLTNEKLEIFERRRPAGIEAGDILEARMVPRGELLMFSEILTVHPREVQKTIRRVTKLWRKSKEPQPLLDVVHRVAYFANRCERYAHLSPNDVFEPLLEEAKSE